MHKNKILVLKLIPIASYSQVLPDISAYLTDLAQIGLLGYKYRYIDDPACVVVVWHLLDSQGDIRIPYYYLSQSNAKFENLSTLLVPL